jgi:membrane-bound serine protease (ClpP class)
MSALGLLLVLVGAALVAAEAHLPSHGALGSAAVVSVALGVALLLSGAGAATLVALASALAVAAVGAVWVTVLVRKVMAAREMRVRDTLIGRVGVVKAGVGADGLTLGQVFVDGALWRARTWGLDEDEQPLARGDACVVERVEGLTLTVRPAEEWELI